MSDWACPAARCHGLDRRPPAAHVRAGGGVARVGDVDAHLDPVERRLLALTKLGVLDVWQLSTLRGVYLQQAS